MTDIAGGAKFLGLLGLVVHAAGYAGNGNGKIVWMQSVGEC